jgi:hypothetical protein
VPIVRYAIAALLGLALLVGVMLLVRPLIFSMAPERGDQNYPVAAASDLARGPIVREVLLNRSHGLPGERPNGQRVVLRLIVAPGLAGDATVVDAWSPTNHCAVEIDADRLRDCARDAWTFQGIPIVASDPPLQQFSAAVRSGVVVADLTRSRPAS